MAQLNFFRLSSRASLVLALAGCAASCGQTVQVGLDDAPISAGASASGAGGMVSLSGSGGTPSAGDNSGAGGAAECVKTACRGQFLECGDCNDNDGDGQVDALDTACLGPCDNDELGLSSGLPSTGGACRVDCYFDGDAGPGNDKCEWSHECDVLSVAPDYPPSGEERCAYGSKQSNIDCAARSQTQPQSCIDNCRPLVPNGCDCFGCCELPGGSGQYHFIGKGGGSTGCQLDKLDDASTCPLCTPVLSCFNPCDKCEVCVGREPDASCASTARCKAGQKSCSADEPCERGDYCLTGCCVLFPVK